METGRSPDPLSPELALVCPELAARARAALPARPWERFAPPRPALRRVARPPVAPATAAVQAPAGPRSAAPGWRPRRGTLVLALLAVALVVTGLLPARDAPTLKRTAPSRGGATFVVENGGTVSGDVVPATPCLPAGATLGTPLAADGTFALVLPIGDAEVELEGWVVKGRVNGSYRVRRPGCDSGLVPFRTSRP